MSDLSDDAVKWNLAARDKFFVLEVGLREAIIDVMDGHFWAQVGSRRRCPDEVQEGLKYERTIPWYRWASYHPIYYELLLQGTTIGMHYCNCSPHLGEWLDG